MSRTYDANGHTTRIARSGGAEKRLSYDVAERLTQVQSETGTPIGAYAYDSFGRRLKRTTASETIYFLHGEEGLLAEFDASGNPIATYGWEPQGMWGTSPVWKKEGSITYFYSNDHLGTPQLLTDASGQIVWKGRAEAFGKTTVDAASTVTNNLRFPGQYFDAETGMHYNYFTDYEPTGGRHVQSDPIGLRGGMNGYVYVLDDPLRLLDAHGLHPAAGAWALTVLGKCLLGCATAVAGKCAMCCWGVCEGDPKVIPSCGRKCEPGPCTFFKSCASGCIGALLTPTPPAGVIGALAGLAAEILMEELFGFDPCKHFGWTDPLKPNASAL